MDKFSQNLLLGVGAMGIEGRLALVTETGAGVGGLSSSAKPENGANSSSACLEMEKLI